MRLPTTDNWIFCCYSKISAEPDAIAWILVGRVRGLSDTELLSQLQDYHWKPCRQRIVNPQRGDWMLILKCVSPDAIARVDGFVLFGFIRERKGLGLWCERRIDQYRDRRPMVLARPEREKVAEDMEKVEVGT